MARRRRTRGQALMEFALVLPIFLLFVAGGIDLARVYFAGTEATDAAREAALYASHHPGYTSADLNRIINKAAGSNPLRCSTVSVTVASRSAGAVAGTTVQPLTINCSVQLLTAVLPIPNPVTIKSTASSLVAE